MSDPPSALDCSQQLARQARAASRELALATGDRKNSWLRRASEWIVERSDEILAANARDLELAPEYGLNDASVDRLKLTPQRLSKISDALLEVCHLPDPVGEVLDGSVRPNGLSVSRVRVPLGVVFFIYESRPNVTADAAALCVKSGNAVILRGGKEALHSNLAFHRVLSDALGDCGLPQHAVQLVQTTDRDVVGCLLKQRDQIDVDIPRGGKSLIERVAAEATMPVIKHFDGVCHVFVDQTADLSAARRIVVNSKCQRPGVCNALESLLVHADVAARFLPEMVAELQGRGVELRCCSRSLKFAKEGRPATEQDFRTEYLDLILSLKIVDDVDSAIAHVNEYGSHHTDAILTNGVEAATKFTTAVDPAAVLVNATTR